MAEAHLPVRRRTVLRAALGAGLGAAAVACANPGSTVVGRNPVAPALVDSAAGDLYFSHWRAEDIAVLDELVSQFAAEHPDVTLTQDVTPSADYQANALQRVRSGETGDALAAFRGAQFESMVAAEVYADLGDLDLLSRYGPDVLAVGAVDGVQRAVPYQRVFITPIGNTDLLEQAGVSEPPPDWDGFLAMCEALRGIGVTPIGWPGGDPGNAGQLVNAMVMNNAPSDDVFTRLEAGDLALTDDWFLTTLGQYAQLAPYMQEGVTGSLTDPVTQAFAAGEVALLATGSYSIAAARALGAEFGIDLVPPITVSAAQASYVGIHNSTFLLGVNTASDSGEAAVAWLDFLSRPEVAGAYADGTTQHVGVADVDYTSPDLVALERWLSADTLLAPRFQLLDLDVQTAVDAATVAVVGGTPPEQAAQDAQRIVTEQIG